MVTVLH